MKLAYENKKYLIPIFIFTAIFQTTIYAASEGKDSEADGTAEPREDLPISWALPQDGAPMLPAPPEMLPLAHSLPPELQALFGQISEPFVSLASNVSRFRWDVKTLSGIYEKMHLLMQGLELHGMHDSIYWHFLDPVFKNLKGFDRVSNWGEAFDVATRFNVACHELQTTLGRLGGTELTSPEFQALAASLPLLSNSLLGAITISMRTDYGRALNPLPGISFSKAHRRDDQLLLSPAAAMAEAFSFLPPEKGPDPRVAELAELLALAGSRLEDLRRIAAERGEALSPEELMPARELDDDEAALTIQCAFRRMRARDRIDFLREATLDAMRTKPLTPEEELMLRNDPASICAQIGIFLSRARVLIVSAAGAAGGLLWAAFKYFTPRAGRAMSRAFSRTVEGESISESRIFGLELITGASALASGLKFAGIGLATLLSVSAVAWKLKSHFGAEWKAKALAAEALWSGKFNLAVERNKHKTDKMKKRLADAEKEVKALKQERKGDAKALADTVAQVTALGQAQQAAIDRKFDELVAAITSKEDFEAVARGLRAVSATLLAELEGVKHNRALLAGEIRERELDAVNKMIADAGPELAKRLGAAGLAEATIATVRAAGDATERTNWISRPNTLHKLQAYLEAARGTVIAQASRDGLPGLDMKAVFGEGENAVGASTALIAR